MILRNLILRISQWNWVERFVRKSFLFRPIVKRFIGGDDLKDGLKNSEPLLEKGFLISLDLLGESVSTPTEANASRDAYIDILREISAHPKFAPAKLRNGVGPEFDSIETINVSIKLTQCGLDISDELAEENYRKALEFAREFGSFVRVDMEASEYTERTISMIERVHADFKCAGTVLQSYLKRTPADLIRLNAIGSRIRLVKGAYLEASDVAISDKADVDQAYIELAKTMLVSTNYPAFATHDERIVDIILAAATELGVERDRFEFQMLFGIRRDLQDRLLAAGYKVRVYVPFGDSWYPYFSRRLAERPANVWFIIRSIFQR